MFGFSLNKWIGIEINGNRIHLARIRRQRRKVFLEGLDILDAPSDRPEALAETLSSFVSEHGLSGMPAALLLQDPRIAHRAFTFPRMGSRELERVVPFEANKAFGANGNNVIAHAVTHLFREEGIPRMEVLVASVPEDLITASLEFLERSGITPYSLMTIPLAQRTAPSSALILGGEETVARLHVTRQGIHLSVYRGKRFLFSRMIRRDLDFTTLQDEEQVPVPEEGGGAEGVAGPEEPFVITGYEQEEPHRGPLERLFVEIQRSFLYVKQQNREAVRKIWMTGEGASFPVFRDQLFNAVELPVSIPDPVVEAGMSRDSLPDRSGIYIYDLCIGAASLFPVTSSGNLLPRQRKDTWRKKALTGRLLIGYAVLFLLLLLVSVRLARDVDRARMFRSDLKARFEQINEKLERRQERLMEQGDGLLKTALLRGLKSGAVPPEDVLAALALYLPDRVILDELSITGGGKPYSVRFSGMMLLPDFSGACPGLDDLLKRFREAGICRCARGRLGSGTDRGESGRVRIRSAAGRSIRFEIEGK